MLHHHPRVDIPWQGEKTMEALKRCHDHGDVIAPLQALYASLECQTPLPNWTREALMGPQIKLLWGDFEGQKGYGNRAFGEIRKQFRKTVISSAYFYVQAWQVKPSLYYWVPSQTIAKWFDGEIIWSDGGYSDALRYASMGLPDYEDKADPVAKLFGARAKTIRQLATRFIPLVPWGRLELENELGLRGGGPSSLFGPSAQKMPDSVKAILKKHPSSDPLHLLPGSLARK